MYSEPVSDSTPPELDADAREVIAWLESAPGEAWSQRTHRALAYHALIELEDDHAHAEYRLPGGDFWCNGGDGTYVAWGAGRNWRLSDDVGIIRLKWDPDIVL